MSDTKLKREDEIDQRAQEMFANHPDLQSDLSSKEQALGDSYAKAGTDQAEAFANDPANASKNIDTLRDKEDNPFNFPEDAPPPDTRSLKQRVTGFFTSKKGATTGIIGGFGIAGIVLSTLFGHFTALINIESNAIDTNDSRSSILDRRMVKWLDKKTSSGDSSGCKVMTKYKCRMGRMPNKMLSRLSAQGIKPLDADGKEITISSESGYADKNPAKYEVPTKNGTKVIEASSLAKEYRKNVHLRSSFKKAYNMRYRAWVGKTIRTIFYNKFNLRQDGGIASDDKKLSPDTVDKELDTRLDSSSSRNVDASKKAFSERFKNFIRKDVGRKVKSSGGSAVLLAGGAYCLAVNAPRIVAGTYRAIQLVQVLALINDVVLSPAGKIKAGDATADEVSALGNKLTETVDGKSALDSPILLSAMGVNGSKTGPSKYAPGYAIYSSPLVKKSGSLGSASKGACNKITSPEAQVAAVAIEAGIAASSAGTAEVLFMAVRAGVKAAVFFGIIDIALQIITSNPIFDKLTEEAFQLATKAVGNYVEGARGEKLGDALGVGLFAYFSMSGLKSGSGVLKKDQIGGFNKAMAEVDNEYREEAIATLSPFDTSSRYTLMGSLVSKLSVSGFFSANPAHILSSAGSLMLSAPSTLLSPIASATDEDTTAALNRCDNNAMFDIEDDIGVNPAGYPCVGIPAEYLDMSIDDVYSQVKDDTDEDTGEWKSDGKIAEIQTDCSDASLDAISGCTITDTKRAAQSLYQYDKNVSDILDGTDDDPETGSVQTGAGSEFRVASFNVLGASHTEGPKKNKKGFSNSSERIKRSMEVITSNNFQIVGLQELESNQADAIHKGLTNFDHTTVGKGSDQIIWDTTKFSKITQGTWKSAYFGGAIDEPWVKLKDIDTGQTLYVMNVHDPINRGQGNAKTRYENALKHLEQVKKLSASAPVVFTGDFNEGYTKNAGSGALSNAKTTYCVLVGDGTMNDAYDLTVPRESGCPDHTKDRTAPNTGQIDHIYLSADLKASTFKGIKGGNSTNGSDHPTVYSDVVIPSSSSDGENSGTGGDITWPVDKKWWNSNRADFLGAHFANSGTWTNGIDSLADDISSPPSGAPVYAMMGGAVSKPDLGGHGLAITTKVKGGAVEVAYAHGPRTDHKTSYNAGDLIMHIGCLGNCYGPHLHIDMSFTPTGGGKRGVCPQDVFLAMDKGETIDWNALSLKAKPRCGRT